MLVTVGMIFKSFDVICDFRNEVSKHVFELTKGSRSKDWCSPLNCSRQFQCVMEAVGRQIRKRADGDKDLLAAIRQHFVNGNESEEGD